MTYSAQAYLNADELWGEACAGVEVPNGLPEETMPIFLNALDQLVAAIQAEAQLTEDGCAAARAALVRALRNQLQIGQLRRAEPAVDEQSVGRPVFITGLHRTGTTLLQSLLAAHPELYAPQLWELLAPAQVAPRRRLVTAATDYVREYHRAAPGFAAIHPLDARAPEECHRLLGNTFFSEIYGLRYRVPSYLNWLATQDHLPAYQSHRHQLRAILWRRRPPGHPVLKCPFHLWHARELAMVYPQARVVRLHRSPVATIGSVCSLTYTIRRARSTQVNAAEIGAFWLERTTLAVARLARRGADAFASLPVLDIRYADLAADPVGVVERVCQFIGISFDGEARRRVSGRARARGARGSGGERARSGVHHYRLDDFGLDPIRVARTFAEYQTEFQL